MTVAHRTGSGEMKSLYQNLLGDAFHSLPVAVRELHSHTESVVYRGRGSVERGNGLLSRIVGALMHFPPAMPDTPVILAFDIRNGTETWTRQFGEHHFQSRLSSFEEELRESFGWVNIQFRIEATADGLHMRPTGWRVLGMPLPRAFWPRIVAHEYEALGHFHFRVEAALPLAGLVVRYRGSLRQAT